MGAHTPPGMTQSNSTPSTALDPLASLMAPPPRRIGAPSTSYGGVSPMPGMMMPPIGAFPSPTAGSFPNPSVGSFPTPSVGSFPVPAVGSFPAPAVGSFPTATPTTVSPGIGFTDPDSSPLQPAAVPTPAGIPPIGSFPMPPMPAVGSFPTPGAAPAGLYSSGEEVGTALPDQDQDPQLVLNDPDPLIAPTDTQYQETPGQDPSQGNDPSQSQSQQYSYGVADPAPYSSYPPMPYDSYNPNRSDPSMGEFSEINF